MCYCLITRCEVEAEDFQFCQAKPYPRDYASSLPAFITGFCDVDAPEITMWDGPSTHTIPLAN